MALSDHDKTKIVNLIDKADRKTQELVLASESALYEFLKVAAAWIIQKIVPEVLNFLFKALKKLF